MKRRFTEEQIVMLSAAESAQKPAGHSSLPFVRAAARLRQERHWANVKRVKRLYKATN